MEEKFKGKDYIRINNNYWNGTIPTRSDTKVSLWIEKDACRHVEFESLPEYKVLNLTFKLDSDVKEVIDDERNSKLKIYLFEDKRFLILPPSPKSEDRHFFKNKSETDSNLDKLEKSRYFYGKFEDSNKSELKFTVESANRFEGGETFEYELVIPTISDYQLKPFQFFCSEEKGKYTCRLPEWEISYIGFMYEDFFIGSHHSKLMSNYVKKMRKNN